MAKYWRAHYKTGYQVTQVPSKSCSATYFFACKCALTADLVLSQSLFVLYLDFICSCVFSRIEIMIKYSCFRRAWWFLKMFLSCSTLYLLMNRYSPVNLIWILNVCECYTCHLRVLFTAVSNGSCVLIKVKNMNGHSYSVFWATFWNCWPLMTNLIWWFDILYKQ